MHYTHEKKIIPVIHKGNGHYYWDFEMPTSVACSDGSVLVSIYASYGCDRMEPFAFFDLALLVKLLYNWHIKYSFIKIIL